jgi:hypothetical protein
MKLSGSDKIMILLGIFWVFTIALFPLHVVGFHFYDKVYKIPKWFLLFWAFGITPLAVILAYSVLKL